MDARNNIATDLFYKIRSRFSGLKLGTETGEITINPEDARFFDFDYMEGEKPIGHVSISLAEENSMKIYFSHGITESMDDNQKDNWYGFLKELRMFAKRRLLNFDTRDIAKDNLDKRDYEFLTRNAQPKQETENSVQSPVGESIMKESTMYGTKNVSYQKLENTKLIVKHSQKLNDDMAPGARSRNIAGLFVENADGERFKYPFIHLAGARAMQRHVANGGLPYDEIGESIIKMSEEIAQLKSFGTYVVRNDLMNSETNNVVERSTSALNSLREQIKALSKQSHYEAYKESFQAQEQLEVPQDIAEQFKEQFTVKNFKEDIATVFPVLYRLMKENDLGYNDIVAMTNTEEAVEEAVEEAAPAYDPFAKFEQWALNLGEASAIQSSDDEEKIAAAQQLQELVQQAFTAGVDGSNAIESLKGIIDDPQLEQEIKAQSKLDPETDVRGLVKTWLETNAPDVSAELDFGDYQEEPVGGEPVTDQGGEETAPEEVPAESSDNNDDTDEDTVPFPEGLGDTILRKAKVKTTKGKPNMKDAPRWASALGQTPQGAWHWLEKDGPVETDDSDKYFPLSGKTEFTGFVSEGSTERDDDTDKDTVPFDGPYKKSGDDKDEFGNEIKHRAKHLAKKGMKQHMPVQELAEFIHSFYDKDSGTFPKGPEGICIMVGKKFGEQAEQVARKMVERMAPQQQSPDLNELARIRELSGIAQGLGM